MTLTYENRALYGRNCYAAQRANTLAKKGAFQQNTTHDIISNLGRRGGWGDCFYYSNHVTCMNTSKSNRTVET